jgi:hypothetical protein
MVRDVRLAGERYGNHLDRLIVVKRLKNEFVKIFDVEGRPA